MSALGDVVYLTADQWQRVADEMGPDLEEIEEDCASWLHYLVRDCRAEGNDGFAVYGDPSETDTYFAQCKEVAVRLGLCPPDLPPIVMGEEVSP